MKYFLSIFKVFIKYPIAVLSKPFQKSPKTITGGQWRVFLDGREVEFWNGEDVHFDRVNMEPIKVLGKLDVVEIVPVEIRARLTKGPK